MEIDNCKCGKTPKVNKNNMGCSFVFISCECGIKGKVSYISLSQAIEFWNKGANE